MDMDRYIGRLLDGRYEIMEIIGTGGMAVVYKARCHRLNRLVAVKILKDELTQDAEFRRRFHAESQAVAALSHPNIVSVYDVSTSDDADYIVMELIDGISLKQYMEKKGILNWKETLHFAIQIAKALDHAHSRGIVHRDIKPHNVMVLKNGSVKVADFGIAQVTSKSNTMTKEALGSVHYISPEQARGGRVDSRSDLYSLGVVMYEMMTGRPPYDGETPVAVAIQHINNEAAMPSTLNPNIPGGLEQIIMKAMEKDPAMRYSTATAMLYDMDEFRKNPAILFDHRNAGSDLEFAALLHGNAPETAEKTTAEKVAEKTAGQAGRTAAGTAGSRAVSQPPKRNRRREEIVEEEDRGGKIATITVALFSLVAIVAIAIVIYMLFQGGIGSNVTQNQITVPNLKDMLWEDQQYSQDYVIVAERVYDDDVDEGHIISQTPEAGERMEKGQTIYVKVSKGDWPEALIMDHRLVGMDAEQAKQHLTLNQGVSAVQIKMVEEYSSEQEVGKVTRTEPEAGEEIQASDIITIYVSKGPEIKSVTIVDLTNRNYDEASAVSWLQDKGFTVEVVREYNDSVAEGRIFYQSAAAGTQVRTDTVILIKVSLGASGGHTVLPPQQMDPEDYVPGVLVIELSEEATQEYELKIIRAADGVLMDVRTVMPGTLSIEVNVTGKGVMSYVIESSLGDSWNQTLDFNAAPETTEAE